MVRSETVRREPLYLSGESNLASGVLRGTEPLEGGPPNGARTAPAPRDPLIAHARRSGYVRALRVTRDAVHCPCAGPTT